MQKPHKSILRWFIQLVCYTPSGSHMIAFREEKLKFKTILRLSTFAVLKYWTICMTTNNNSSTSTHREITHFPIYMQFHKQPKVFISWAQSATQFTTAEAPGAIKSPLWHKLS